MQYAHGSAVPAIHMFERGYQNQSPIEDIGARASFKTFSEAIQFGKFALRGREIPTSSESICHSILW